MVRRGLWWRGDCRDDSSGFWTAAEGPARRRTRAVEWLDNSTEAILERNVAIIETEPSGDLARSFKVAVAPDWGIGVVRTDDDGVRSGDADEVLEEGVNPPPEEGVE
jgi:hypothetical protein